MRCFPLRMRAALHAAAPSHAAAAPTAATTGECWLKWQQVGETGWNRCQSLPRACVRVQRWRLVGQLARAAPPLQDWDNSVDLAATNLAVNRRGAYPADFRAEHSTAPGQAGRRRRCARLAAGSAAAAALAQR